MMSATLPHFHQLERPIEIYENERLWLGRGFSKKGLLPTERGPFSTQDGSLSWKTMKEASLALLRGNVGGNGSSVGGENGGSHVSTTKRMRRGWSFHEENGGHATPETINSEEDLNRAEDEYECTSENNGNDVENELDYCGFAPCAGAEDGPTDKDGWSYFPDFSPQNLLSPSSKRGILDFVRRRKLRRVAVFRPDHFLPREVFDKCDFCDSKGVEILSNAMLDALALASLFLTGASNSPKDITDSKILPLKAKLIDALSIGKNCSSDSQDEPCNPWSDIERVRDRLSTFAENEVGRPGVFMHMVDPDVSQHVVSAMPKRKIAVSKYLDKNERLALAKLLIKDIDRYSFKLHCKVESCGSTNGESEHTVGIAATRLCEFRLVTCPNENCPAVISFKYKDDHDSECGFKRLPCSNGCGEAVPRNQMNDHVKTRCILRPAECPLKCVGCNAVVQAQDTSRHLNESADQHLILVVNRMMEYQAMFKKMTAKIALLEEKNARLESELKTKVAGLSSKNEAHAVSNDLKKVTKRLNILEGTCRTEFKKVQQDRRNHVK